ncbi:MAG: ribokinase [Actinomycetota bacterium]|nr:ribokinase [Actinomycetota bacterium]
MTTPVVVLGSLNMDLVVFAESLPESGETVIGREFRELPGGKGLNQAVAAARAGARTVMVGAVGADAYGAELLKLLGGEQVDGSPVRAVPGARTGVASIGVDAGGANRIVVVPGANGLVTAAQVPDLAAGVLLASLEIPVPVVAEAFARAHRNGMTTILNPAPAALLPEGLLATCDVLVPNEHEAAALTGESTADLPGAERAAGALCARGPRTVVVTLGARGALVMHAGRARHVPAVRVQPVDTTAAGDAFCGVLAARLAAGDSVDRAVSVASAAGALATTVVGAAPSLPQWAAIQAVLAPATQGE